MVTPQASGVSCTRAALTSRTECWGCTEGNSQHGAAAEYQQQLQEPGMSQREAGKAAGTSWLWEGSRNLPGLGKHLRQPILAPAGHLCWEQGSWCSWSAQKAGQTHPLRALCLPTRKTFTVSSGAQQNSHHCSTEPWAAFTLTFKTQLPHYQGTRTKQEPWEITGFVSTPPYLQNPFTNPFHPAQSQMTFSHSAQNHCIIFVNTGSHAAGRFTAKPRTRTVTNCSKS